jgi:hypothetical protein
MVVAVKFLSLLGAAGFVGSLTVGSLAGCGSDEPAPPATTGPGVGSQPLTCAQSPPPEKPAASCDVTIEKPPEVAVQHIKEGSVILYCSNPPSSGPHYPVWAGFQEHTQPMDSAELAPYLVHSLEHGAVALFYKCEPGSCPEVVDALKKIRDGVVTDSLCSATTRVRVIISPSRTIKTKVAAAAWGATYQAACVDEPSLAAFVKDRYAKGPENLCVDGRSF